MQPNNTATLCTSLGLHDSRFTATIGGTTKTTRGLRTALNRAFFMPKIRAFLCAMGMKNRIRILNNADGLRGLNTRPFKGNKSRRLVAVVDARPPVLMASGQELTKPLGGQSYA